MRSSANTLMIVLTINSGHPSLPRRPKNNCQTSCCNILVHQKPTTSRATARTSAASGKCDSYKLLRTLRTVKKPQVSKKMTYTDVTDAYHSTARIKEKIIYV